MAPPAEFEAAHYQRRSLLCGLFHANESLYKTRGGSHSTSGLCRHMERPLSPQLRFQATEC